MRAGAKILVPVAATVATLLVAEALLRLFAPVPPPAGATMIFAPDPETGYRLEPGGRGSFAPRIEAIANRHGHRDDPVEQARRPGVPRILVLGDSFTAGASVEQHDAYPQVLERWLTSRREGPVEVINAGVGGWGPYQYRRYFESRGHAFQPDLVIVGFFVGNDTYDPRQAAADLPTAIGGRRVSAKNRGGALARLRVRLIDTSHVARLALARGMRRSDPSRTRCDDFSASYLALQERRARRNQHPPEAEDRRLLDANLDHLAAIALGARRDGAETLVVWIPEETQVSTELRSALSGRSGAESIDPDLPSPLLTEAATRRDLATLDLLPTFRQDGRCLYLNDSHWTAAGHRLAAEQIAGHPAVRRLTAGSGAPDPS